jgi:hypothetical protein
MHLFATTTPEQVLEIGKAAAAGVVKRSAADLPTGAGGPAK